MVELKNPITSIRSNWKNRNGNETLRGIVNYVEFWDKPQEEREELWRNAKKREENRLTWSNLDANGKVTSLLSLLAITIPVVSLFISLFKK
ncbi:hypothetical protein [Gaoshiqia sediminis]|uniref:Uncharacterized protein n=1 Tax=Gaoshiqia sediminis TaxID=2986998 RepID=A0AA42CBD6_9BACT|nr:hypothetical protein [Gaoshiqia sediminis]MCW0484865.1 hypothetical protein [Gaoshiqia sediminis]